MIVEQDFLTSLILLILEHTDRILNHMFFLHFNKYYSVNEDVKHNSHTLLRQVDV
jgi:hypothetical protein